MTCVTYPPQGADSADSPRYALSPGLELIPHGNGGILLSLRPLLVLRLNPQAFALLAELSSERSATEVAQRLPAVSSADAMAFFDRLAHRRLLTRKPVATTVWPKVSIIIPAHGRPHATRACIESLLALDYPPERREIIVVDDASEPPLATHLLDLPIRLLRQNINIGQSAARNRAAQQAQGDMLAFIDNDCIADPSWLRNLIPYLQQPDVAIVGGRVIAPDPESATARFEALRSPLDMGSVGGEVGPQNPIAYLPTCNLIVRRDVFMEQQGFDERMRLGEDVDFIWRVLDSGSRAWYAPAGEVIHSHRVQLGALLRRRAEYASSEADLQNRHGQGRRVMALPRVSLLLLGMLMLAPFAWPLAAGSGLIALGLIIQELNHKSDQLRQANAGFAVKRLHRAVLREHLACFYHLSANSLRYYSLPLSAMTALWPQLLPSMALLLLAAPVSDYYRLRPRLAMPVFVGLYGLEMAAYQIGLWRGCWRRRTLRPLLPILQLRR